MKKLNLKVSYLLFICITLTLLSCNKGIGGEGGNVTIEFYPNHHGYSIKNAKVYLKYNTKSKPATIAEYDKTLMASTQKDGKYFVEFKGMTKGVYYVYAEGYDDQIQLPVTGGKSLTVRSTSGVVDYDLEITE